MSDVEYSAQESRDDTQQCQQCQQIQPLQAFPRYKRKNGEYKSICCACEQIKQQERHRRVEQHRQMWPQQQEQREECKQREWGRRVALREEHEQRQQERERWYLQQPEQRCHICLRTLPASAFGGVVTANGFTLHRRCKTCHELWRTRRQPACCLCQKQTPRSDFLAHYDGYELCSNGVCLSLCCKGCEPAFRALSRDQQQRSIRICCQRTFPPGQVVYAEVDPETDEIRYVGRTGKPARRHVQHLSDTSPAAERETAPKTARYTRRNWMHTLSTRGLTPSMQILQRVEPAPFVIEWEQRYIWHGMQQGWKLLNAEALNTAARIQASPLDFLQAPFEQLLRQQFFSEHSLVAFLHKWY